METQGDAKNLSKSFPLGMYANEPCRICGELINSTDVLWAVFAGYSSDSKSRAAHKACWDKQLPQEQWVIPV